MARLRVLKHRTRRLLPHSYVISLTMARLRVLKLFATIFERVRKYNFTHHGPFEGTETEMGFVSEYSSV